MPNNKHHPYKRLPNGQYQPYIVCGTDGSNVLHYGDSKNGFFPDYHKETLIGNKMLKPGNMSKKGFVPTARGVFDSKNSPLTKNLCGQAMVEVFYQPMNKHN